MEIKDRIKEIRSKFNLTQQEFAERLGIKRNTIATYETGKSNPSDSAVVLICKEFNVNENWFRTGEGEMFNPEPTDMLDQLATEYGLSDIASAMVKCFINLKPEIQNEMFSFFNNVVSLVNGNSEVDTEKEHQFDETMRYALELFRNNFSNKNGQIEPTVEELEAEAPRTPDDLEKQFLPAKKPDEGIREVQKNR